MKMCEKIFIQFEIKGSPVYNKITGLTGQLLFITF